MTRWSALVLLAGCAAPVVKPAAKPAPIAVASAPPPAPRPPPEPAVTIAELTPEAIEVAGNADGAIWSIDGATILTSRAKVELMTAGGKFVTMGKIPEQVVLGGSSVGFNTVFDVQGRYPDSVDVFYRLTEHSPMPTFMALTGKAKSVTVGAYGARGEMISTRADDSTVIAAWSDMDPFAIRSVRGPALVRKFEPQSTCKAGEANPVGGATSGESPAVVPRELGGTANGRLVSIGRHCEEANRLVAEVWDPGKATSHIVDLRPFWRADSTPAIVRGAGADELWARVGAFDDVLHIENGAFALAPHVETSIREIFMSPKGELHVRGADGMIHRLRDGSWAPVAHVADGVNELSGRHTVIDANGDLWMSGAKPSGPSQVYRLRETSRAPVPVCASWFVHVATAPSQNPPKWTYPSTQKALAGFPDAASLHLVEFDWVEMGIPVTSHAQGVALIDHMKTTAPDLRPALVCFTPPAKGTRTIPVAP